MMEPKIVLPQQIGTIAAQSTDVRQVTQRRGVLRGRLQDRKRERDKIKTELDAERERLDLAVARMHLGVGDQTTTDQLRDRVYAHSRKHANLDAEVRELETALKYADRIVRETQAEQERIVRQNLDDPEWRRRHGIGSMAG